MSMWSRVNVVSFGMLLYLTSFWATVNSPLLKCSTDIFPVLGKIMMAIS